jgi:multicomponent Na+:H+ antiporter subunit G
MVETLIDVLSWILFAVGSALVVIGALGIVRFPDFYTRLHAAGITDTFGADLVLLAMALQADNLLVVVKLGFIFLFLVLTSPVSTHAIAHAALVSGLRPRIGKDLRFAETDEECNPKVTGS